MPIDILNAREAQDRLLRSMAGDLNAIQELLDPIPFPPPRRNVFPVRPIVAYTDFNAWTASGTGATWTKQDTTTPRVRNANCATVTTNGAGGAATLRLDNIATAIDLSNAYARVWVRIDRPDRIASAGLSLYLSSDATITASDNYRRANFHPNSDTQGTMTPGEWVCIDVPIHAGTHLSADNNTPVMSSINAIQLRLVDDSTGPITASFGGLEFVTNDPAFPSGVVTFAFDDGFASLTLAQQVMSAYGYPGVAYVMPDRIRGASFAGSANATANYASLTDLRNLQDYSGWDIAYHDDVHFPIHGESLTQRVHHYQRAMMNAGFKATHHVAYPGGNWSYVEGSGTPGSHSSIMDQIPALFSSARGIHDRYTAVPNPSDPYRLPVFYVNASAGSTMPIATITAAITAAKTNKAWIIIVFHDILAASATGNAYNATGTDSLDAICAHVRTEAMPVRTMTQMLG